MTEQYDTDVIIIGAGPSGTVAACLLRQLGHRVTILERSHFPRFVIGESLLPQCLTTLAKAGCLTAVENAGFQVKTGATFQCRGHYERINFAEKFSSGPATAFHVERAQFDEILAQCAQDKGTNIKFGHTVTKVDLAFGDCKVSCVDDAGTALLLRSRFVFDASGYGRVLPRMLGIDKPSELEPKGSLFSHVKDHIDDQLHSRAETLITTHPEHKDVWYWLISFANGRSSVGVVGNPEFLKPYQSQGIAGLKALIGQDNKLSEILEHAAYDTQHFQMNAYSGNVSDFWGDGFAILGNAGEFLDPIFSSGVTVAMRSADLAVSVLDKQLKGDAFDWDAGFVNPLKVGVNTFKCYVTGWYQGGFQDVIYASGSSKNVKEKIASILAGYAWDEENPYVKQPQKRLNTLVTLCQK